MKKTMILAFMALNTMFAMAQNDYIANPVGAVFAREGGESPAGTFRLTSGGYEVFTVASADKDFQPASLYYGKDDADKAKVDAMAPDGKVPTSMNCFVVRIPDGYIMFDTGLPTSKGGKTLERLKSLGISPEDIKAVFLTHSHFDHIGGLIDDAGNAEFPNASLYIPSAEFSFLKQSMKETCDRIADAYNGRTIVFETGDILPGNILPISAKGHTPGHTAYQLGNLLFVGDLMHGASIQLLDPEICASYDADRQQSIATRRSILSYAAAHSMTVLGAHIPLNGVIF